MKVKPTPTNKFIPARKEFPSGTSIEPSNFRNWFLTLTKICLKKVFLRRKTPRGQSILIMFQPREPFNHWMMAFTLMTLVFKRNCSCTPFSFVKNGLLLWKIILMFSSKECTSYINSFWMLMDKRHFSLKVETNLKENWATEKIKIQFRLEMDDCLAVFHSLSIKFLNRYQENIIEFFIVPNKNN